MNVNFQLIPFLVVSCQVLWITNAENQDGTIPLSALPLPPPDANAMQDEQQAIAAAMSAAATGHPVPKDAVANSAGIGLGEAGKAMAGDGAYGASMARADMAGSSGMASSEGMGGAGSGISGSGMPGSGGQVPWGMASVGSGKLDNEVTEAPKYCYAQGPLLPESLLPKPKQEGAQIDVGNINCEEVVGYLMGLNRFYDRKCSRMGSKCPYKYKYAVSWFGVVGHQMMAKCNIAVL